LGAFPFGATEIDTAHQAAVATLAGAVERRTAALNRAIGCGARLENRLRTASGIP
jgi:hypothetical protein